MYYHVKFGSSATNGVRIDRREPQNWRALWSRPLAVGASLTPINTLLPTCVILPNSVVRSKRYSVIKEILLKNLTIVSRLSRSLKVIGTDTYRSAAPLLLTFHGKHGTISYRFRDKRQFQPIIVSFPTPVYFVPRWSGSPWNWVSALGVKKLEWWGFRAEKEVWRYLQPSGYTNRRTDGRTDGRTPVDSKDRAYIASRGNQCFIHSFMNRWYYTVVFCVVLFIGWLILDTLTHCLLSRQENSADS